MGYNFTYFEFVLNYQMINVGKFLPPFLNKRGAESGLTRLWLFQMDVFTTI